MIELQDFIRRSAQACTAKDVFGLPRVAPLEAVPLDYDRIAVSGPPGVYGKFSELFRKTDNCVKIRGFEDLSPLTQRVLSEESEAGTDLENCSFALRVHKTMFVETAEPIQWHIDFMMPEDLQASKGIVAINKNRNYVSSTVFCTAITALKSIEGLKPEEMSFEDFGRILCLSVHASGNEEALRWKARLAAKGMEDVDRLLGAVVTATQFLKTTYEKAAPNEIACIGGAMPHGYTCRVEPDPCFPYERVFRGRSLLEVCPH